MGTVEIAAVSRDESIRAELARAFDKAPARWRVTLHESPPGSADVVVFGPDVAGRDGIVLDPSEPERLVADVTAALDASRVSNLVAVTGVGGGVGATTVALHLAAAAGADAQVCCVDRPGGGIGSRLDLPAAAPTWADGPRDPFELLTPPVASGFRVLLAPEGGEDCPRSILDRARVTFDHVIAETTSRDGSWAGARVALFVMTPTIPSARRAAAIMATQPEMSCALVTNRLGPGGEATRAALEAIVGCKIAIELPTTPALRDAEDDGRLVTSPWFRWTRSIARLWRALERA